jgi:hypothetical protein
VAVAVTMLYRAASQMPTPALMMGRATVDDAEQAPNLKLRALTRVERGDYHDDSLIAGTGKLNRRFWQKRASRTGRRNPLGLLASKQGARRLVLQSRGSAG